METTTETSQNHRELTATEIKITLAQIEDRLVRSVEASKELYEFRESLYSDYKDDPEATPEQIKEKAEKYDKITSDEELRIREKYEIPDGVFLFLEEGLIDDDKPVFMKFAKLWATGQMDDDSFYLFTFHFDEINEVDYFWVLMDKPANYYNEGMDTGSSQDKCGYVTLEPELKRIGTRSKKKGRINFKLTFGHGFG